MKLFHNLMAAAAIALLIGILCFGGDATAQDTYAEPVAEKVKSSPALKDFESRLTRKGAVMGPFNIVVAPTDKGSNGIKYTKVPYFQFIGNSIIAFPVGKPDRFGNQEYIYASSFTVQVLRRVNPAERTR